MNSKTIGIVGCGVVGGVLVNWLKKNTNHRVLISDPAKGFSDNLSPCDIIFINIHIPTMQDGSQNLSDIEHIIEQLPNVPIYIRTTILPGTSEYLSEKYRKSVYFMPEFLTERSAQKDFNKQTLVYTGHIKLLKSVFKGRQYIYISSKEAEVAKYAHNVFGALKVTYFNVIYDICKKEHLDYKKVLKAVLLSGYINSIHTQVPGPDGHLGYGGKCFPKDVSAFKKYIKSNIFSDALDTIEKLNQAYRLK